MNKNYRLILISVISLLLIACTEKKENNTNSQTIENPVATYIDSRVSALDLAKESVKNSNKKVDEQNKIIETLK